nr:hypothetical protein [uncultured Flavobacterium sp.]
MKASIIYTVAVSVVLISNLEIRLDKNNFAKIGTKTAIKINPSLKQNESQKNTVDFTKVQLAKTTFEGKNESRIVLVKPALVLEEAPIVLALVSSTQNSISFESAIIEETEKDETKALDFNWINTLAMYDEAIVSPSSNIENNILDFNVIGEDSTLSEQPLDFKWIDTLQMFDEPIVTPKQMLSE